LGGWEAAYGTGGGAGRRLREQAAADSSGLAAESRKCDSGHSFDSSLAGEKENEEGNTFKGLRRGTGGRGRLTAARHGTAGTVSKRRGGKGRGKGKSGRRGSSPESGTPAVACGNSEAARQRL
jgi:hypothetical protein